MIEILTFSSRSLELSVLIFSFTVRLILSTSLISSHSTHLSSLNADGCVCVPVPFLNTGRKLCRTRAHLEKPKFPSMTRDEYLEALSDEKEPK